MAALERKDISVYIADQAVEGAIDALPKFKEIRGTSGIVQSSVGYLTSSEVITDGQAPQQVPDKAEYSLTREFEMSQETISLFKDVIHSVPEDNSSSASTAIAATATGFTVPAGVAAKLIAGDWFYMKGFANSDLDKLYKLQSKTSTTLTTVTPPTALESTGASVAVESIKASSGTTKSLKLIQNRVYDGSKTDDTDFESYLNCFAATGSITVEKSGFVTGSIEYKIPKPITGTSALIGQADLAKDESDFVNAINNVIGIYENGVHSNCSVQTMSLEFANNYEGDGGSAGCKGEDYGRGQISVTGSLFAKTLKSNSMLWRNKNKDGTASSFAVAFTWDGGDKWAIMEITRAIVNSHVFDGDVIKSNSMEYTASGSDATGKTFQIFSNF